MAKFLKDMVNASRDDKILSSYDKESEQRAASFSDGHEEGVYKTRKEVAETMLRSGYDISEIIKISKLTEKEILEIKKDLKI